MTLLKKKEVVKIVRIVKLSFRCNDSVGKTTCFYFCPFFYKSFRNGKIPKNSVIFDKKPSWRGYLFLSHM